MEPSTATPSTADLSKVSVITATKYVDDSAMSDLVRELASASDIISTIAGTGAISYSGDGGAATSAAINYPNGVALDASGRPRHSISSALS